MILEKEDFYYKEVPSYQPFQRIFSISEEKILTLYGVQSFKKLYTDEVYYELDEMTSKTQHNSIKWMPYYKEKNFKIK